MIIIKIHPRFLTYISQSITFGSTPYSVVVRRFSSYLLNIYCRFEAAFYHFFHGKLKETWCIHIQFKHFNYWLVNELGFLKNGFTTLTKNNKTINIYGLVILLFYLFIYLFIYFNFRAMLSTEGPYCWDSRGKEQGSEVYFG